MIFPLFLFISVHSQLAATLARARAPQQNRQLRRLTQRKKYGIWNMEVPLCLARPLRYTLYTTQVSLFVFTLAQSRPFHLSYQSKTEVTSLKSEAVWRWRALEVHGSSPTLTTTWSRFMADPSSSLCPHISVNSLNSQLACLLSVGIFNPVMFSLK